MFVLIIIYPLISLSPFSSYRRLGRSVITHSKYMKKTIIYEPFIVTIIYVERYPKQGGGVGGHKQGLCPSLQQFLLSDCNSWALKVRMVSSP